MRLDLHLANKHPELSRSKISDLIKRGYVFVDEKKITKAGFLVTDANHIEIKKEEIYVSRAGEKLVYALDVFNISLKDLNIIDVGASTGGFTDASLRRGAFHVYAYDVGKDQMVEQLKNHPQVTSFEETNILDVKLPNHDLCLVDVSFTSVLPILNHLSSQTDSIVFLLKPQFETEGEGLKKGILKDQKVLQKVLDKTIRHIHSLNFRIKGYTQSPIKGKDGNQEFLFYICKE